MHKILIEDIEKEVNGTLFYEFNEFMEEFGADISADLEFLNCVFFAIVELLYFFTIPPIGILIGGRFAL